MLVDSHAHLDAAEFAADRDAVIRRAQDAGLRYVLLIADLTKPESVQTTRELAERYEGFYWAAGIDPHEATSATHASFKSLAELATHPKFLAIGEIGLDYYYDYPRDTQQRVFIRQLDLARELQLPVIIHCRDAWSDARRIFRDRLMPGSGGHRGAPACRRQPTRGAGILHCFTGTVEEALDCVFLGFYISFAGNLTFKKAEPLRTAAHEVPLDRLLTETDSPYLAPAPHRGKRNEPAYVAEVTRVLGQIRGLDEREMGRRAVENFEQLFGLEAGTRETREGRPKRATLPIE